MNAGQTTARDGGRGGGVIHLAGHTGARDGEVPLADGGGHADVGWQQVIATVTGGGVNAQAGEGHRFANAHVFVTEQPCCRADERHGIARQRRGDHSACDHCICVGVVDLVRSCQACHSQRGAADAGCDTAGLGNAVVASIRARQAVACDDALVQSCMFVDELTRLA